MTFVKIHPVTFGGPIAKGTPYWKFKSKIKKEFQNHQKFNVEFEIDIELFIEKIRVKKGRNDLDNFLKPIIDALEEIKIIKEYKMGSIKIRRTVVDSSKKEGVDIKILKISDRKT